MNGYNGVPTLRRAISFCLALAVGFSLLILPAPVAKAAVLDSGSCGENVTWTLYDNDVVRISGEGPMYDYTSDSAKSSDLPWWKYYRVYTIIFEDGVTHIGSWIMAGNTFNHKVVFEGNSLRSIGRHAFSGCRLEGEVVLPAGLTTIGEYAFYGNKFTLKEVAIPDSVTYIGEAAFSGCNALTSVDLPDGLEHLGARVFQNCTALTELRLPGGIGTVTEDMISGCTALKKITIGAGMEEIGSHAFTKMRGIEVVFEGSAPKIDSTAFRYATATAYFPENDPSWTKDTIKHYGGTVRWFSGGKEYVPVIYHLDAHSAGVELSTGMIAREPEITVHVRMVDDGSPMDDAALSALSKEVFAEAQGHSGEPCGGDYLRHGWDTCSFSAEAEKKNGEYFVTIDYTLSYYTTAEQEAELNAALAEVMAGFGFEYDTPCYERVAAVYDYVCENVTYDNARKDDEDYKLKYTAYAALVNGTAVCQGYATLLYRMLLEAGVDNRVITGEAGGERHAWNIVEMEDNFYYNADSTWDAITGDHSYFLRTDVSVSDHIRHKEYAAAQFVADYPMGESDYVPHVHSYTSEVVPPTCYNMGYTVYFCSCGDRYTKDIVPATEHRWDEGTVTPPTCTEEGYTTYACVCGDRYSDSHVPATGHQWDEGTVTVSPTETDTGVRTHTCTACGEKKIAVIPEQGHVHSHTATVFPPTCTEEGYTTHTCSCGDSYTDSRVPAAGHSFGGWVEIVPPGCTLEGRENRTCSGCGQEESRALEPAGHIEEKLEAVEPTCYLPGYTEGWKCTRCHDVTVKQEVIPALDHDMEDGVCTRCGYTDQPLKPDFYVGGPGIKAGEVINAISASVPGTFSVWNGEEQVDEAGFAVTGMVVKLTHEGETTVVRVIVISGDVNGDGKISVTDLLAVKSHLLGRTTLENAALCAADISGDQKVTITDFIQIKSNILGKRPMPGGTT